MAAILFASLNESADKLKHQLALMEHEATKGVNNHTAVDLAKEQLALHLLVELAEDMQDLECVEPDVCNHCIAETALKLIEESQTIKR